MKKLQQHQEDVLREITQANAWSAENKSTKWQIVNYEEFLSKLTTHDTDIILILIAVAEYMTKERVLNDESVMCTPDDYIDKACEEALERERGII